jgi:hypothetical protein
MREVMIMCQATRPVREVERQDQALLEGTEWINRKASEQATRAAQARGRSGRRRFIDPTTCEREYTQAELEFMLAMNQYKRRSGRMFPSWGEVLEVLRGLGYQKVAPAVPIEPASEALEAVAVAVAR